MEPTTTGMRAGDQAEWNAFIGRHLPQLKRFAERHLPAQLRGTITADELVQEVVLSGIRQLHRLELRHDQAFLLVPADIGPPSHCRRDQKNTASAGPRSAERSRGLEHRSGPVASPTAHRPRECETLREGARAPRRS